MSGKIESPSWTTKKVKVKDLKAFEKNPRKITPKEMDSLKRSIAEDGYHQRILCTTDLRIIGGHQRIQAMLELGYAEVEVLVPDREISDEQFSRILVRDNMEYGTWNIDGLGELMPTAQLMEIGLGDNIINKIPQDIVAGNTDPDEVPEPPKEPLSAYGDVWQLGDHRLMCGDATRAEDMKKLMGEEDADMVLTDPPYNTGMSEKKQNGSTWLSHMFNDSFSPAQWQELLAGFTATIDKVLRKDSFLFIFLDWRRSHELIPHLKKHWSFSNLIVWDKMVHGLGSDYKYSHEFIHVCKKGKPPLAANKNGDAEYQDMWHIQRKVGRDDEHATKKPIELLERAIRHASHHSEIVLDPFGGSGSTLMACERLGRVARIMELDAKYVDVIIKRWSNYTGQSPVKVTV